VANLKRYNSVFRNARKIYHVRLRQASLTPKEHVEVKSLAEELKTILMDIDNSVPGSHTPLWPCFVGGAESSNQIERSFFYARLERLWNMTGSRNPYVGMRALLYIWSLPEGGNWEEQIEQIER
jgi:hypothetical protein